MTAESFLGHSFTGCTAQERVAFNFQGSLDAFLGTGTSFFFQQVCDKGTVFTAQAA
jgi:hypothetical protein